MNWSAIWRWIGVVVAALVVESILTAATSLFVGPDGVYGAPIAVGHSCGFCVSSLGGTAPTMSWPIFALDIGVTAGVFGALASRGGRPFMLALGSVLFLVVAMSMHASLDSGLPFAGIPLPVAGRSGSFDQLNLWIDCMTGSALFALAGLLRSRGRLDPTSE